MRKQKRMTKQMHNANIYLFDDGWRIVTEWRPQEKSHYIETIKKKWIKQRNIIDVDEFENCISTISISMTWLSWMNYSQTDDFQTRKNKQICKQRFVMCQTDEWTEQCMWLKIWQELQAAFSYDSPSHDLSKPLELIIFFFGYIQSVFAIVNVCLIFCK